MEGNACIARNTYAYVSQLTRVSANRTAATLYILSKKLAKIVSLTLTLHYSLSPSLRRAKMRDPEHHKYDNAPPEVSLIAVVLVVLKLVYGLDDKRR